MDDITFSGETSTALDNPAAVEARTELAKIISDPAHPHHAGLRRNSPEANAHLDGLYKKAYPQSTAGEREQGVSLTTGGPDDPLPTLSPEDAQAGQALQQEWGGDYAAHMADAQFGVSRITRAFGGEADDLIAAVLAAVDELPPEIRSQVGGLKFVTNIARHFGKQARTYAP